MKKIISLIVISVMLLSALAMNVGAAEEFSREDAEKLFTDAFSCYVALQESKFVYDRVSAEVEFDTNSHITIEYTLNYDGVAKSFFDTATKVKKIIIGGKEYGINNISDINSLIEVYYVPGYYDVFTKGQNFLQGKVSLFYEGTDKGVYCISDIGEEGLIYLKDEKGSPLSFGEFNVNGDKATLNVRAKIMFGGTVKTESYFFEAPVEFLRTEKGWRVSGGAMVEIISRQTDYKPYVYKHLRYDPDTDVFTEIPLSPNTSDPTAIIIALLALSGVALVVVPRKRRKMF